MINKIEENSVEKHVETVENNREFLKENVKTDENSLSAKKKTSKKSKVKVNIMKGVISFVTLLVMLVVAIMSGVTVINLGPSTHARDLFVVSVMETSGIQFLAKWYFSDEEIKQIQANNSIKPLDEKVDIDMIDPDKNKEDSEFDINAIEIVDVSSAMYNGKMMIINDPSRVIVGTIPEFGKDFAGIQVSDMVKKYGAIGGTNAGAFLDLGGVGNGGTPLGMVISEGVFKSGSMTVASDICGFDKEGRMHVGMMTGQEALDLGIRDAVFFGPTLIVNSKPAEIKGTAGGWNPRTAIGQRADGAVLLLVIDGRQTTSIGATHADLIKEMQKFGAVNAYNLDGGTSSHMVYNNEIITNCSSLYGTRRMPTAILIKGVE